MRPWSPAARSYKISFLVKSMVIQRPRSISGYAPSTPFNRAAHLQRAIPRNQRHVRRVFLNKATGSSPLMKFLLRKITSRFAGALITLVIALCSSGVGVQAQPTTPPAIPPSPRLTLTAEQEYIIREIVLNDVNVPKEKSASETVGDS